MLAKGSVMLLKGASGYPRFEKAVASISPRCGSRVLNTGKAKDLRVHVINIAALKQILLEKGINIYAEATIIGQCSIRASRKPSQN